MVSISVGSNGYPNADTVTIRLPHPDNCKAVSVSCGQYDPDTETVVLNEFCGQANIELLF